MSIDNDVYATTDLSLAAALCLDFSLISVEFTSPKQAAFHFRKSDNLTETVGRYWTHQLRVDPMAYFFQLKQIKSRLYSEIPGRGEG